MPVLYHPNSRKQFVDERAMKWTAGELLDVKTDTPGIIPWSYSTRFKSHLPEPVFFQEDIGLESIRSVTSPDLREP